MTVSKMSSLSWNFHEYSGFYFSKSLLKYTFLSRFPKETLLKIWKFAITSRTIDLAHVNIDLHRVAFVLNS